MASVQSTPAGWAPPVVRPAMRRRRSAWLRRAKPYLFVAPAILYLLSITLYPGIYAIYQSFFFVRFNSWTFAGLANYHKLLTDPEFWQALRNTAIIGTAAIALECVIALALAAFAYRDPFVRSWRIIFLMPMLFMPSAVAFIWKLLFNDGRIISDLLDRIGLIDGNLDFLGSVWLARLSLVIVDVWQWTPFLFIIFVAALQGQDAEMEEAARLDGASWPKIFWNISLPLMMPVLSVALVLRAIDIVTMFASVFIITGGTPGGTTETISYFIYRIGFKTFNFGYASAVSVVMLALTTVVAQLFVKRFFRSQRA